ncbi:type VI secretion system baseplate subunit TssK [Pelagibaculum spongiae]|uniref:Type VI secretion system baseplate subunit TssK n=1 Tax=Pelagibaculum spongiae TaxID=2080658 RepID=A0A2V1GRG7_9GAMM|nr:type VI secretion system baseplate subunit TssK [Pelagibaculum spongiae]PVZ67678.1 type VI secretion system baseplate subunit TssK [Pelagibaculum spongiae]
MSWNNKVAWLEGTFLRPQHFQQQDRFLEAFIEGRVKNLRAYSWGFSSFSLDQRQLEMGKIAITEAIGVFPDGTVFRIPEDHEPPSPIEITENTRDQEVYLCLPFRKPGISEIDVADDHSAVMARYKAKIVEARDNTANSTRMADIQVGSLKTSLMLENQQKDDFNCLPICKIIERKADESISLEKSFIPTAIHCQASEVLVSQLSELNGLLTQRANALAARVSGSGRGGTAEIADFLFLQVVNRSLPVIRHLQQLPAVHPEEFYRFLISLIGELSSFAAGNKMTPELPAYKHNKLSDCFSEVSAILRDQLSMVMEQTAVSIKIQEKRFGIKVGTIADLSLLDSASFVLAVKADISAEDIRRRIPLQIKIGSVEQIRELVNVQLPGIPISPLPVAPRQIPYHSGFVYFELDKNNDFWQGLKASGNCAMHLGGEFPGLEMEFWAIRG